MKPVWASPGQNLEILSTVLGYPGSFSLYIYFIFVDIFPAFLPPQLGRVFAGSLCNVIQGMEM